MSSDTFEIGVYLWCHRFDHYPSDEARVRDATEKAARAEAVRDDPLAYVVQLVNLIYDEHGWVKIKRDKDRKLTFEVAVDETFGSYSARFIEQDGNVYRESSRNWTRSIKVKAPTVEGLIEALTEYLENKREHSLPLKNFDECKARQHMPRADVPKNEAIIDVRAETRALVARALVDGDTWSEFEKIRAAEIAISNTTEHHQTVMLEIDDRVHNRKYELNIEAAAMDTERLPNGDWIVHLNDWYQHKKESVGLKIDGDAQLRLGNRPLDPDYYFADFVVPYDPEITNGTELKVAIRKALLKLFSPPVARHPLTHPEFGQAADFFARQDEASRSVDIKARDYGIVSSRGITSRIAMSIRVPETTDDLLHQLLNTQGSQGKGIRIRCEGSEVVIDDDHRREPTLLGRGGNLELALLHADARLKSETWLMLDELTQITNASGGGESPLDL